MAHTIEYSPKFISVTMDASIDFDLTTYLLHNPQIKLNGLHVAAIRLRPTATSDSIVIRDAVAADTSSPRILSDIAATAFSTSEWLLRGGKGIVIHPAIDATEITGNWIVIFELA
jgi:hypothetical protein